MYEDCVEKFNCNRYPGHCSPACYRPIGQHNEPGVNSYKCCTCTPEVVEVFPMDRIWEGPAGRDGKDGSSLEFAWEGTRLKVRVKGTEEWVYSTSLLGMQGPKGDTGEKGETGAIGPRGYTGAPGQDGDPGADGNGVDYVELHSSSGIIKTYRIHFTDGTYFDFTVTDGIDGINGQDGEGVVEGGTTGQVLKKKSNDDFDTEWVNYAYDDLSGRPKINNITLSGNKSLSDLGIKQTYNKSDVGLGNVDNVRQYSASNPPPYPVTSVNGSTGAVVIDTHDDLIPTQASPTNKLTTENFVNSTVATSTATFRGTYNSLAELEQVTADENDYGFVVDVDSAGNTVYNRYKYASGTWTFEYALNNSSFTAAQWEAIQSGITDNLVTKLQGIEAGAEVNIVEGLKIGNVTQQVSNKIMQINPDTTPMQGSNNVIDSNAVYEVEKLLPTDRESGENVDIDNAQPYKVLDLVADGKYQQNTTSGKQLFAYSENLASSISEMSQTSKSGSGRECTLTATNSGSTSPRMIFDNNFFEVNTTYYVSFKVKGDWNKLEFGTWINDVQTTIVSVTPTTTEQLVTTSFTYPSSKYQNDKLFFKKNDTNISVGQYITISDFMISKDSDTNFEPYTGGIPSPNPNYPQPITQVTSATWNRVGKQLFDKDNANIIRSYFNSSTTTISDNANSYTTVYIPCKTNTTYTISKLASARFSCGYTTETPAQGVSVAGVVTDNTASSITISTGVNAQYIVAFVRHASYDTLTEQQILDSLMIAEGTDTTYSPYQGQTIPIDLDGNEVCATDTIKDKLLVDRYGNVAIQKNVGKVVLNGSESYVFTSLQPTDTSLKSITVNISNKYPGAVYSLLTSHFVYAGNHSVISGATSECCWNNGGVNDKRIGFVTKEQTIENFKTWLSTHNTTVYYALATPQIIPLPKLSVLPSTLKGINHIWVDTNLGRTQIEVEYVKDLSLDIPTKTSELTNDSGYVKNTDYAAESKVGVIKSSYYYGTQVNNTGILMGSTRTYQQYTSGDNSTIVAKGTLENVLTERIGTIETALTTLDVGGGVQ